MSIRQGKLSKCISGKLSPLKRAPCQSPALANQSAHSADRSTDLINIQAGSLEFVEKQQVETNAEEENWDQANMMKLPENIMSQQQD